MKGSIPAVWSGTVGKLNVKIYPKVTDMGVALHASDSGYDVGCTYFVLSKWETFPINHEFA